MEPMRRPEDDQHSRPKVPQDGPVISDFSRKQWIVPVYGVNGADPDGIAQTIVRRDGTMIPAPLPPYGAGNLPEVRHAHLHRNTPSPDRSLRPQRRPDPVSTGATMNATRTIGLRIRRVRTARNKSLRVIAGLAGMSSSTLHRVEHGQREPTLSEILALANALKVDPAKLITLPILTPTHN